MDSELYYLCKEVILWWDMVKDQYVEMPGFVQHAIKILGDAVANMSDDEVENES